MSIRNLDALFAPKAIALVGASNQPGSIGSVLAANMFSAGFSGPIVTVNPRETAVRSTLNYRSVADLPIAPDLAVVATPPQAVPALIEQLGAKGCRAAVVVTAGFGEGNDRVGENLRLQMLAAARPRLLRIIGPNCLGFLSPVAGINGSFAHLTPQRGNIALVTQSGAIATALIDWAASRGLGFSHVISLGDMADVDFGDLLDYLALDRATHGILLYIEGITQPRKFMSAARIAARAKPVIVVKAGRHAAGASAALSHTGALAGSDLAYDAAFRRAGILRVAALREMFEAFATLASGVQVTGNRLVILTNGGGLGVMATDALEEGGGELASLSSATLLALSERLPPTWSHANPVDIIGDATGDRYEATLRVLVAAGEGDAILVINCPTAIADRMDAATKVARVASQYPATAILACWVGEGMGAEARGLLAANRIPSYDTPEGAVRAFVRLLDYRRNQEELLETPPADPAGAAEPDRNAANAVVRKALDAGRTLLTAVESKALLSAYRIPVVQSRVARNPEEAAAVAAELDTLVALKILSPDITHKSDVGGVRIDLPPLAVLDAAHAMMTTVRAHAPDAAIAGFTVEPMAARENAEELLIGIAEDQTFGSLVLFGHGGVAAEAIADRALALPPLNLALARHLIERTRVYRLLRGYRGRPPAALDAIAQTIVRVSQMAADLPELVELDINPLLAGPDSVIAVDARAVLRLGRAASRCLAICPYPVELVHETVLPGGQRILVRPIRPQDEPGLVHMVARSSLEDVRLRFFQPLKQVPHQLAARLSQIDYDREMAFVATDPDDLGEIFGIAWLAADPDKERAEYAVMVRSDLQERGIGYRLMQEVLAHARRSGIKAVFGEVLRENVPMLKMARELGFAMSPSNDPSAVMVDIAPMSIHAMRTARDDH